MENELTDIVTTRLEAVREGLRRLDITSLPSVSIDDIYVSEKLPINTTGLYFVTHATEGVLYIGKALNLRGRWGLKCDIAGRVSIELTHVCLGPAMSLGNVRLSWWPVPKDYLVSIEDLLIRDLAPKWNGRKRGNAMTKNP